MANPKTGSNSKNSFFRGFFGGSRSKSSASSKLNKASTTTHVPVSLSATKVSSSTANYSISSGDVDVPAKHVLAPSSTDVGTLSVGSSKPKTAQDVLSDPSSSSQKGAATWTVRSDIFPKNNVARVRIDIPAPKIGHDFKDTARLAICADLLNKVREGNASFCSSSAAVESVLTDPCFGSPSASQRDWILGMENNERQHLDQVKARMVEQFISNDRPKDSETIREIVLLGPVLNSTLYNRLLGAFLELLDSSFFLETDTLLGLVQLIQVAPKDYLTEYELNRTLRCLSGCLHSSKLGKDMMSFLILAITMVLALLVSCQNASLEREMEYEPLLRILVEKTKKGDPVVKYQAEYACQTLLAIPDDETTRQKFFRHFLGLSSGLLGMSGVIGLQFDNVAENLPEVIRGARGLIDLFRKELGSGGVAPWFDAVQKAEKYAHEGDFFNLKELICKPRNWQDSKFLWGISRLLGEIAADPSWDVSSREQAIEFLCEIFKISNGSKQDQDIPRWILAILRHLANSSTSVTSDAADIYTATSQLLISNSRIKTMAQDSVFRLKQNGDKELEYLHPLRICLPLPSASLLLKNVNDHPDLDHALRNLRRKRLDAYEKDGEFYIPGMCKASLLASDDDHVPLRERVEDFLEKSGAVLLIMGDSGAGKSIFNRHLEYELWTKYNRKDRIPLLITLPAIDNPESELIAKQLKSLDVFSSAQIQELKRDGRFVMICDGYDEIQGKSNLYHTNKLNEDGDSNIKMIVSCRSTYLGKNRCDLFCPRKRRPYGTTEANTSEYGEAVIIPFFPEQIELYVCQFVRDSEVHKVTDSEVVWDSKIFLDKLHSVPNLMDLVKNPFLLSLALIALPELMKREKNLTGAAKVNRLMLYDGFIVSWLKDKRQRLGDRSSSLSNELQKAFDDIFDDFEEAVVGFLKKLAAAIFLKNKEEPMVKYTLSDHSRDSWKKEFFGTDALTTLLRQSSPLSRVNERHKFLHHSLLEYFYARYMYEIDSTDDDSTDDDSTDDDSTDDGSTDAPVVITDHPLSRTNLVTKPSIIQFLAEQVQGDPDFEKRLRWIIEQSKTNERAIPAATNAITILVQAGARFHGEDLKGIRVPGADLSGGQFDCAQLQDADLRNSNLANTWLRNVNLSNAKMEGVRFGELAYVEVDGYATACSYSPDGKMLVVGLDEGGIVIDDTSTWRRILRCPVDHAVTSVAFSPDSQKIVSGGKDGKIRLWDCTNGAEIFVMEGHDLYVTSVTFSPCGKQIASSSADKTARLWDSKTGTCTFVLKGHTKRVRRVIYSPDGRHLVSGGLDDTVRFWNPETGEPGVVWNPSMGAIASIAFSRDGQWIASAHEKGGLQCRHAVSGEQGVVLRGHTGGVTDVTFSPDGKWIASSSNDATMRVWSSSTGTPVFMSRSHKATVQNVTFSADGRQIASGGRDRKVRLWELDSILWTSTAVQDQLGSVVKAMYSPNGQAIITGISEQTVKQWNSLTGAPIPLPIRLPESLLIDSVSYSVDGIPVVFDTQDENTRLLQLQQGGAETVLAAGMTLRRVVRSPNSRFIASLDYSNTVELWELGATQHKRVLLLKGGIVGELIGCLTFSTAGDRLAVSSWSGIVWIFDSRSGNLVISKKLTNQEISAMSFSPNDLQLAIGTADSSICFWDLQSDECALELKEHTRWVTCVAYAPCGQWIASSSVDKTVRLWSRQQSLGEKESWSCIHTVNDFFRPVMTTAWNPTAPMEFVTGCRDESIRVWRVSIKGEDVDVKLVWGTNLNVLHASGLVLKGATGLNSAYRRLLIQRGAIDDVLPLKRVGGLGVEE